MPQQKLGFNRTPVPFVQSYQPLYDLIKGVPLRDANNNPIVTLENVPLASLAKSDRATSVVINNDQSRSVKIIEDFPESSEVSSTLLGIPRAETQLSLFSDVSTYGLNPEEFEFYSFNSGNSRPSGWYTRRNDVYGNHFYPRLKEETNEQALVIEAYPVNYSFARGPRFERGYDEAVYNRFVKFIRLGIIFFNEYKANYLRFARLNFIDPNLINVNSDGEVEYFVDEDEGYEIIERWTLTWMDIRDSNINDPKDPSSLLTFPDGYGSDETRPGAGTGRGYFGLLESRKSYRYQPGRISGFTFGFKCSTDGASVDNIIEWGIGNPTDQYIFQVRGASFSIVRRSTVPLSNKVLRDQGFDPDDQKLVTSRDPVFDTQYHELVIGRDFFNADAVDGNGPSQYLLDPEKVTMYKIEFGWYGAIGARFYIYIPTDYGGARWALMHQLVIENKLREPCLQDPNFKFRYSLNINDTSNLRAPQFLYKYGASCYIDGGDEGSKSVYSYTSDDNVVNASQSSPILGLLPKDTLSNTAGEKKPNKNNVYPSTLRASTDQLTELQLVEVQGCPAFGHHYSPSLRAKETGLNRNFEIIKSGTAISVVNDPEINIVNITNTDPAVVTTDVSHGYYSRQKTFINNVEGMPEVNNKEYYLDVLSNNTFALYDDSVLEESVDASSFSEYTSGGTSEGIPIFLSEHDDSKIITNGLFSTYMIYKDEREAEIARLGIESSYTKSFGVKIPDEVDLRGETGVISTSELDFSNARFTNYDALATTDFPLTGDVIDFNFLNPFARDQGRFAEFLIGITEYKPVVTQVENSVGEFEDEIKFTKKDGITLVDQDIDDLIYEEFTHRSVGRSRDGYEVSEGLLSRTAKMEVDYRLPNPPGEDSGSCASVRFVIESRIGYDASYASSNPKDGTPGNFLVFDNNPTDLTGSVRLIGGEFGIGESSTSATASGIRFLSDVTTFVADANTGERGFFAEIDQATDSETLTIWLSPVTMTDRTKISAASGTFTNRRIFSFEPKPFYLVIRMRDNARINNPTFTEFFPQSSNSFCPEWLVNNRVNVVNSGNSQSGVPAENFQSSELLESSSVDTGLTQPLRPAKVKDTLYIAPNTNAEVSLENIYGPDRTTITPGQLNTTATFITARSLADNSLNIVNVNINTKE